MKRRCSRRAWSSDTRFEYVVYAYVFNDGHTYIGATKNPKRRHAEHGSPRRGTAVSKFASLRGLPIPDMLILYDGLTDVEARKTEDLMRMNVPADLCLNVAKTGPKTGSVGGNNRRTAYELAVANRIRVKNFSKRHPEYYRLKCRAYRRRKKLKQDFCLYR